MDLLIGFFRDGVSGFIYFLYLFVCIFAFFYVYGFVANRKRKAINAKLKEKKTYDIESGKEAAIAAMETKQIMDVEDENAEQAAPNLVNENPNATLNNALNSMNNGGDTNSVQKEATPNVMVLSSDGNNQVQADPNAPTQEQSKAEQPLVIDTSSVQ